MIFPQTTRHLGYTHEEMLTKRIRYMTVQTRDKIKEATPAALKAVIRIMESWSCSRSQMSVILAIPYSTLCRYIKTPEKARLSRDQQTRLSYILNIYQLIRMAFNNQANVDNFMSLKNHNGQFKGRRPIDLLLEGSIENIRDTYRHIDELIYGR
tara:strand:- start:134 stop:595 length:462 start_codon:yes stop_codon:yes gene_type:complete